MPTKAMKAAGRVVSVGPAKGSEGIRIGGGKAAKVVFLAGAVLVTLAYGHAASHPSEKAVKGLFFKQFWAIGILTMILAAAADFAPEIIVPFAVAIVVGYAIVNPGAFSAALGKSAAAGKGSLSSSATGIGASSGAAAPVIP